VLPPRLPERRSRARRARDAAVVALVALAAFALGLGVFNSVIMPRLIHGRPEVLVPDLSNLSVEQAEAELEALKLELGRSGARFDPSVPRGFILAQDPLPGTSVRTRRKILVMVSQGEEFEAVPGVVGSTLRGAVLAIEHSGLGFAGTTRAPSNDVGPDMVAASDPAPGAIVPNNWPVGLLVATGPLEEDFVMPALLGQEAASAHHALEDAGFNVEVRGSEKNGMVLYQNPAAGSRVVRGATIFIQAGGRARK
jgi:serine/threonine-protein kinase